jgi:hypothetical protein
MIVPPSAAPKAANGDAGPEAKKLNASHCVPGREGYT